MNPLSTCASNCKNTEKSHPHFHHVGPSKDDTLAQVLTNVMESDNPSTETDTSPQHWRSCKLMIDPALTKGLYKVYRFDGRHFNIPVEDLGLFPVDTVRDPRICRLWSRSNAIHLVVPKFKVDGWYVGPVPPKEVTFSGLNDNVREAFLTNMCKQHGNAEEVEIFYNPKNRKHLGIAKVVFDTVKAAKDAVQHLDQTSVMGNIIHVEIDPKGENRARYLQLLLHGLYTPWTLPVGSSERALDTFIDRLLAGVGRQRPGLACSPASIATPLSLDTACSGLWQDTPCSFGLTPRSQGTPRTPCLSATPLSQDSCYSSLQATPVLQGDPPAGSAHGDSRLCRRKPARCLRWQPPPPPQRHASGHASGHAPGHAPGHASGHDGAKDPASPCQEPKAFPQSCSSFSDEPEARPPRRPASGRASGSPRPHAESLDSRIESLLINSRGSEPSYFARKALEAAAHSQDSPNSPRSAKSSPFLDDSLACSPASCGSVTTRQRCSGLGGVGTESLVEDEEDETIQAVSFLTRNSESPSLCDFVLEQSAGVDNDKDLQSLPSLKNHREASGDVEHSHTAQLAALAPTDAQPQTVHTTPPFNPQNPPATRPRCSRPPVSAFAFPPPPFPPSVPPVPPRLPNGTIPIPPPGWIPPQSHHTSMAIPPPPIPPPPSLPPPPSFLGPPPPLMVPPSLPPPAHMYPLHLQPPGPLNNGTLSRHGSTPFPLLPWSAPPFPSFNPFVPPPHYTPMQENPHRVTVDQVLKVLMDELKSIIKKDITRRMIEGVAFKAFEDWWNHQETKTKIQVPQFKSGAGSVGERNKLLNPLSHIRGQAKKPPLPSFKVKRKTPDEPHTTRQTEKPLSSISENSVVKLADDVVTPKRRHARPHELDSDDDDDDNEGDVEGKGEDGTCVEEAQPDKVENLVVDSEALQIMNDQDDVEESFCSKERELTRKRIDEDESTTSADGAECSDEVTEAAESASEESENSSEYSSSDSASSESFEDSSFSDTGPEDEDMQEDAGDHASVECIVISSDEESMEYESPHTPSAPLTPGAQLDLGLQGWSDPFHKDQTKERQSSCCHRDICEVDVMMDLHDSEPQDLQPPSPVELPVDPDLEVVMESPEWTRESPQNLEAVRPLTPTGCLLDNDPELLIKSKPTSPAAEEVERPQTPGKGIVAELEGEDSGEASEALSPLLCDFVPALADLPLASCPFYQEMPKTPGEEERSGWTECTSERTLATPGREMLEGSAVTHHSSPPPPSNLSVNPYITAPKTPGRDIILPRRATVHRRKAAAGPLPCDDSLHGSPTSASSPGSASLPSSDPPDDRSAWSSSCVRTKPLQGLENMPGLLGKEAFLLRRRRLKRRWRDHQAKRNPSSLSSHGRPRRRRSLCEARRILHSVWKEGLDEEDARLLLCAYERLQEQDSGFGWLSDTVWIHHPLTKVPTDRSEEHRSWLPKHRTGSARSEGFYRISRKDKLKYLNDTKATNEPPAISALGTCIPAQHQTSVRAGSDFRSEQRRLLSSFSCDSDLVKFNQLKFRKKRIRFSRSHIHEWGLFAMEPIAADEMVIEYVGQIIRQVIADMREQRYEEEGIGSSYLFRVDQDTIIDATKCGNLARFINHSCNPNCYAKIITVESQKKIVIYSRQPISVDEEITYDYKFPIEEEKIPCLCGADNCRGSLN
ncbi:histone-lysine N-methyltransferase SETD1B-A-like [Betta splendens]|uniref:[histone H3]-lysine(4) N-trimethyltransferase n=1 Tax=Betta splendens TaxID=158456 RepID=A0A8M1HIQ5_BETSP|nr:histone-lysine N-methyltransferase SETD1B-A-like [Betta splendens]